MFDARLFWIRTNTHRQCPMKLYIQKKRDKWLVTREKTTDMFCWAWIACAYVAFKIVRKFPFEFFDFVIVFFWTTWKTADVQPNVSTLWIRRVVLVIVYIYRLAVCFYQLSKQSFYLFLSTISMTVPSFINPFNGHYKKSFTHNHCSRCHTMQLSFGFITMGMMMKSSLMQMLPINNSDKLGKSLCRWRH